MEVVGGARPLLVISLFFFTNPDEGTWLSGVSRHVHMNTQMEVNPVSWDTKSKTNITSESCFMTPLLFQQSRSQSEEAWGGVAHSPEQLQGFPPG